MLADGVGEAAGGEGRIDPGGLGVQVEQPTEPGEERHEGREEREREVDVKDAARAVSARRGGDSDGADVIAEADGAEVATALDRLDPRKGASVEVLEERVPGKRGAVGERESQGVGGSPRGTGPGTGTTESRRAESVAVAPRGVEPAQRLKACGIGDLRDGEVRIGKKPLGEEKPVGLGEVERSDTGLALEGSPEVAHGDAETCGEVSHGAVVEGARGDAMRRGRGEAVDRVARRATRREFGPAAEARPEAGRFGRRRRRVEAAVLVAGDARGADRPAVDARRGDPDEEDPVEAGIPRVECLEAGRTVEWRRHGVNVAFAGGGATPESDLHSTPRGEPVAPQTCPCGSVAGAGAGWGTNELRVRIRRDGQPASPLPWARQ